MVSVLALVLFTSITSVVMFLSSSYVIVFHAERHASIHTYTYTYIHTVATGCREARLPGVPEHLKPHVTNLRKVKDFDR